MITSLSLSLAISLNFFNIAEKGQGGAQATHMDKRPWIKGHVGRAENECVDALARARMGLFK